MKIISLIAVFVLLGVSGQAQSSSPRVIAEIAASSERLVKNSPFSADAVSESVQTLADGNRIVRSSTSKLYRNSEGRFRREMVSGSGGMLGSLYTVGQGVTLLDPVGGYRYMIDPNLRTTRQMVLKPLSELKIINGTGGVTAVDTARLREELKAVAELKAGAGAGQNTVVMSEKLKEEIRAVTAAAPAIAARAVTGQVLDTIGGVATSYSFGSQSKWDSRTEELGVQNIEGVDAEGSRTITTIPAGAIGNERPIEITYEKWYSRDLQLVVMSKHNDPRFGEQTYRLTNIVRNEPDSSLFTLPTGYTLITEPSGRFTVSPKAAQYERAVKAASGVGAAKAKP
jgi:hypothetical protein